MRPILSTALVAAFALLPALAAGHPPATDPHNSCLQPSSVMDVRTPPVLVQRTLSYLAPVGTSLPCGAADAAEFGSHAAACPAPPWTGPVPGAYCGPMKAAGATATCTWTTNVNTLKTELVVGFDGLPGPNGVVSLVTDGERPVFGPFPPGAWRVPNPYGVPARVIAYPTNVAMPPDPNTGALAPGDSTWVVCV